MKPIWSSAVCCVLMLFLASVAYGGTETYVRGSVGQAMPNDSEISFDEGGTFDIRYDDGLVFSLATGAVLNRFRQELEITYQKNDLDEAVPAGGGAAGLDGDIWCLSLLFNGYFDFANRTPFTPFLSAGLGVALLEVSDVTSPDGADAFRRESDVVFAYQGGGGIAWAVHDKITLDVMYRYFATLDPNFDIAEMDFSTQNVFFGIRVKL